MRTQPKLKHKREPISQSVQKEIRTAIQHTANKFNVSKLWVVAVVLGDYFGIDIISYIEKPVKLRRIR